MTQRCLKMHPAWGLLDANTAEALTAAEDRAAAQRRWEQLDDEAQQDLERQYFEIVLSELAKSHQLTFRAELPWPEQREELARASAALGIDVDRRRGSLFSGPLDPSLIDPLTNGGTFLIDVFASGELILRVDDDLADVFLYLTDDEIEPVRNAFRAAGFSV